MMLTLTVLRCPPSAAHEQREVTGADFSIGRGPENDWVLADPDRFLSKRHCVIAYRRGAWQVAGTSTNGTFVNGERNPLEAQVPRDLADGDRLRLGAYEIEVRLSGTGPSPFNDDRAGDTPPRPVPSLALVPALTPVAAPTDLLAAFLRGAGMPDAQPRDPLRTMEQLGATFRAMVAGVRRALIARSGVKRGFRIEATEIRPHGNNVLKFSANDDDALAGLLGTGRPTDMSPEEAMADALTDMRLHELATMAAMQDAVRALVARLGPEHARSAADQAGGLVLPGFHKSRAYDAYVRLHAKTTRSLSDDFDNVFGKRFARAYEKAMQDLSARQNSTRSDRR